MLTLLKLTDKYHDKTTFCHSLKSGGALCGFMDNLAHWLPLAQQAHLSAGWPAARVAGRPPGIGAGGAIGGGSWGHYNSIMAPERCGRANESSGSPLAADWPAQEGSKPPGSGGGGDNQAEQGNVIIIFGRPRGSAGEQLVAAAAREPLGAPLWAWQG